MAQKKYTSRRSPRRQVQQLVFERQNYLLLIAGVLLITLGFVLMRIENKVDGIISLYLAPVLILGGYLEIIWAILWKPRKEETSS